MDRRSGREDFRRHSGGCTDVMELIRGSRQVVINTALLYSTVEGSFGRMEDG